MKFKAQYKSIIPKHDGNSYWRTIDADSEPEANRLAARMTRQNYRLILLTQDEGNFYG